MKKTAFIEMKENLRAVRKQSQPTWGQQKGKRKKKNNQLMQPIYFQFRWKDVQRKRNDIYILYEENKIQECCTCTENVVK